MRLLHELSEEQAQIMAAAIRDKLGVRACKTTVVVAGLERHGFA